MKRALIASSVTLLLVVLIPLLLVVWLVATESGLAAGWAVGQRLLPEGVTVGRVEGALIRDVRVTDIRVVDAYNDVTIDHASINWTASALADGLIRIDRVAVGEVTVTQLAAREPDTTEQVGPPEPLRIPSLPRWVVDRVEVASFRLQPLPTAEQPATLATVFEQLLFGVEHAAGRATLRDFAVQVPQVGIIDLHAVLRYGRSRVEVETITIALRDTATTLTASGAVDFTDAEPVYSLAAKWTSLRWPLTGTPTVDSGSGSLDASGTGDRIKAVVDAELGSGRVSADAKVDLSPADATTDEVAAAQRSPVVALAVDARVRGQALQWPLRSDTPQLRVSDFDLRVDGKADDYALTLDAGIAPADAPSGRLTTRGRGSQQQFRMQEFRAELLDGTITGNGQLRWQPALSADLDLTLLGIDPASLDANWPGKLGGDVVLRVRTAAQQPVVHIDKALLTGQLRGRELSADIRAALSARRSDIEAARIALGPSEVTVSGSVSDKLDLKWSLNSPDLDSLWPGLRGSLTANGQVSGTQAAPRVVANADGSQVGYSDLSMETVTVRADVDVADARRSLLEVAAVDGQKGLTRIDRIEFAAGGRHAEHDLRWAFVSSEGRADGRAQGNFNRRAQRWQFKLEESNVNPATLAGWQLREPVSGEISAQGFSLPRSCWDSADSRLCAGANSSPKGFAADLEIVDLPYGYFAYLLPAGVKLTGAANGTASLRGRDGEIDTALAVIEGSAGQLTHKHDRREEVSFDFAESRAQLELKQGALWMDSALALPDGGGLTFTGRVASGRQPLAQRPLTASFDARVRDLSFTALFLRELTRVEGELSGQMKLSGTLAKPQFDGELVVSDAVASLATPGIDVENIDLRVIGDGNGVVALQASARSGEGKIELDGQANLVASPFKASATLRGKDFQVANLKEISAWASPDVKLTMNDRRIDLTGEVVIPTADITPRQVASSGGVTATRDQVIIMPGDDEAEPLDIYSQLRITFGDAVRFEGFGLKTRIAGSIEAIDRPGQLTSATGELRLEDGYYKAYGQDLDIRRGKLLFKGGPVSEPGLDILAARKPNRDIEVGVLVRGRLEKPEFRLYSNPTMAESDQLSWLVLGRPMERGSGSNSENAALANAALALGLKGGKFLAGNLPDKLGIDSIEVGSAGGSSDQAALVIGKYLSPRLYVSYGIGLFEPSYTFRLRYELSRAFTLLTESGAQSSGDIVYTFEN